MEHPTSGAHQWLAGNYLLGRRAETKEWLGKPGAPWISSGRTGRRTNLSGGTGPGWRRAHEGEELQSILLVRWEVLAGLGLAPAPRPYQRTKPGRVGERANGPGLCLFRHWYSGADQDEDRKLRHFDACVGCGDGREDQNNFANEKRCGCLRRRISLRDYDKAGNQPIESKVGRWRQPIRVGVVWWLVCPC